MLYKYILMKFCYKNNCIKIYFWEIYKKDCINIF